MLPIAKILKSNGTDGGILVSLRGVDVEEIDSGNPVFIVFDELPVPFFIVSIQRKGASRAVLHLADVENLRDAEELVGRDILVEGEDEGSDELDFTGWTLLDRGAEVGEITGMEPIPGNLCLYVGDKLVPLHEDFVISCDPEARVLDLDLPEGLLDS